MDIDELGKKIDSIAARELPKIVRDFIRCEMRSANDRIDNLASMVAMLDKRTESMATRDTPRIVIGDFDPVSGLTGKQIAARGGVPPGVPDPTTASIEHATRKAAAFETIALEVGHPPWGGPTDERIDAVIRAVRARDSSAVRARSAEGATKLLEQRVVDVLKERDAASARAAAHQRDADAFRDAFAELTEFIAPQFNSEGIRDGVVHTLQMLEAKITNLQHELAHANAEHERTLEGHRISYRTVRHEFDSAATELESARKGIERYKAKRDGYRATIADQATQIRELRSKSHDLTNPARTDRARRLGSYNTDTKLSELEEQRNDALARLAASNEREIAANKLIAAVWALVSKPDTYGSSYWTEPVDTSLPEAVGDVLADLRRTIDTTRDENKRERAKVSAAENASREHRDRVKVLEEQRARLDKLAATRLADFEALTLRIGDVANEAFGPFPVLPLAESITMIERGIFRQRTQLGRRRPVIEKAQLVVSALRSHPMSEPIPSSAFMALALAVETVDRFERDEAAALDREQREDAGETDGDADVPEQPEPGFAEAADNEGASIAAAASAEREADDLDF